MEGKSSLIDGSTVKTSWSFWERRLMHSRFGTHRPRCPIRGISFTFFLANFASEIKFEKT